MRKILTLTVILSVFLSVTSCENEEDAMVKKPVTELLDKVETSYMVGDEKIETSFQEGVDKKETDAPEGYKLALMELFEKELNKIPKTRSTKGTRGELVGVIKYLSCGRYDELEIHMDCEDSHNHNYVLPYRKMDNNGNYSYVPSWVGDTEVDKNITLKFCLVPKRLFKKFEHYSYGVLSTTFEQSSNDYYFQRHFDNEDSKTKNWVKLNGVRKTNHDIAQELGNGFDLRDNTLLTFQIFLSEKGHGSSDPTPKNFPNLGIEYGVFGYIGQGWVEENVTGGVHIDDEDHKNMNYLKRNWSEPNMRAEGALQEMIKGGHDTELYMSLVRYCNQKY